MPTFDSMVRSQTRNRPIILYTITTATDVFRHTTHGTDVTFGDDLYTALTVIHDDAQVANDGSGDELVVHLPISHPFVRRYASTGIPEETVRVVVRELQEAAGASALTWSGVAQSLTVSGHMAAIRVPSPLADSVRIQLPFVAAQRNCPHVLFDSQCTPNPGGDFPVGSGNSAGGPVELTFTVPFLFITAISADGVTVTLVGDTGSFLGFPAGVFTFGKLRRNGRTHAIASQTAGGVFTVDPPLEDVSLGESVSIVAGCDKTVATCKTKFGNVINHGGAPQLNSSLNLWQPNGLGIIQQV